uniref:Uncharacterized protein n=1 Tax=Timema poppense TaxID=170557 RepID=A0A7R9CNQ5_TIMPO|nr:unnamed protein product [Timema poppensis]
MAVRCWALSDSEDVPASARSVANPSRFNMFFFPPLTSSDQLDSRPLASQTPVAMMMELSHSLTLNEEALQQIPEAKRPVFVFEWLRFLDKVLVAAQKVSVPFLGVLSLTIL